MLRPEILSLRLCPVCGVMATNAAQCSCGSRRNIRGWYDGVQPPEVEEAVALLRSVVKMLPRQADESEEKWLERICDLTGHICLQLEERK